jgi:hypothetical protein
MAVDVQPWCLIRLSSSAAINDFSDKIDVRWGAVSDNPDLLLDVGIDKVRWDEEQSDEEKERSG